MSSRPHSAIVFAIVLVAIFILHVPLLQLPYFWDEAGYYVPAARDLLLHGSLIPITTVSNAHPPLVMAWVALWWKLAGFAPLITRSAMLAVAAFSLLGLFRVALRLANVEVAVAATVCTALYPVFFAQSSLAQVDLAAAGLTFWALSAYFEGRPVAMATWFSLAALAKETAILAPVALAGWEILRLILPRIDTYIGSMPSHPQGSIPRSRIIFLLTPIVPLVLWYAYHYLKTGYVFGNPEFFRYNVASTMNPLRFLLALLLRLWEILGYMHLWVLTVGMALAMLLSPVKHNGLERRRIAIPEQAILLVVIAAYVAAMALIGGAVLARYMLPAVPLVIILAVATLWRRLRWWPAAIAIVGASFVLSWFWNPPYGFSPEDNLSYRDFIVVHQNAERFLEARYPMARVLTAWPASGELVSPWLGYTTRPMQVVRIEDFSLDEVLSAAEARRSGSADYDIVLVFSDKYEPARPLLERWTAWTDMKRRFFGYHRDVPPELAAQILGGKIVFIDLRNGQWAAVIEIARNEIQEARLCAPHEMAGVGLDDQPDLASNFKLK